MQNNKKTLVIGSLFAILVIGSFAMYQAHQNKKQEQPSVSEGYTELREPSDIVSNLNVLTPDNTVIANTDWFDDNNAPLVFADGEHWVWYEDIKMESENCISGTYEAYYGQEAYNALDDSLFVEGSEKPAGSDNSIVIKMNILSLKEDGNEVLQEQTTKILSGNLTDTNLSLIDMNTLDNYNLTAEQKFEVEKADVKVEEIMKDITYSENMEAWKTFEIKVNGQNLTYPYSAHALLRGGLNYGEPDKNNGRIDLTINGEPVGIAHFMNTKTDNLYHLSLDDREGVDLILPNGITWGSKEEDVLKAYGKPNDIQRGSVNEKYYYYNTDTMTMILTLFTEDCDYGTNLGLKSVTIQCLFEE